MRVFLTPSTEHLRPFFKTDAFPFGRYERYLFSDGERGYRLKTAVKNRKVAVIASVLPEPDSLFELLCLVHLARENGAEKIILAVPYLGYARQDRSANRGEGKIGSMVARLIRGLNPDRLIVFEVHSEVIRKELGARAVELSGAALFARHLSKRIPQVIVSPDKGSVGRARRLAELLNLQPEIAWIEKVRPKPNLARARRLFGDVSGKEVLILDDMIDTGGTIVEAVKLLSKNGASQIRIAATHGIFSGKAKEHLAALPVQEILVTNTLPQRRFQKLRVFDISPLLSPYLAERTV